MPLNTSEKISECRARIADLRKRAAAEADPDSKAELRGLELQWLEVLESYELVADGNRFLNEIRARRSALQQKIAQAGGKVGPSIMLLPAVNGASLGALLEVLICAAIEHAEGKARAAFYLSDAAELELHHIVGMPPEYARCVNGFAISEQSLACGLAVATRRPIITPDVSGEPRWKEWLWLAKEFGYRACWSFPVATSSGKVLGSFAMYYAKPREATPRDVDLASVLTRTAAMIISRH